MNVNGHDLQKGVETIANLTKIAANITDPTKKPPQEKKQNYKPNENTNQPHTQTVEVKVGDQGGEGKKPVIVKEKTETHIHKHFPDNRALTPEECELEKFRIQMEYDEKQKEREHAIFLEELARKERKELEEKAHVAAEKRAEKNAKLQKRLLIYGGIAAGIGLVGTGYYLYTDSRRSRNSQLALRAPQASLEIPNTISAEGTVK